MAVVTLLVGSAFSFGSAIAYAYAGYRMRTRPMQGPAQASWRLFLAWWFGIAALAFVSGVLQVFASQGITQLEVFVVGQLVSFLLVCVAHFGLIYYLVTLFTGRWGVWKPLLAFYIVFYLILVYDLSAGHPDSLLVGRWRANLNYASVLTPAIGTTIYSLLIVPPLLGSLAYGALYFRATERTSRFRILIVSSGIFLWAIASVLIALPTFQDVDAIQFGARAVGLGLAFVILCAYFPPRWLQKRLGVSPVSVVA